MELKDLIQIAGTLVGFQLTIFIFRMTRELAFDKEERWFPLPDFINLFSVVITVFALFLYPLNYNETPETLKLCKKLLGFSVLLLAIYPFALMGTMTCLKEVLN